MLTHAERSHIETLAMRLTTELTQRANSTTLLDRLAASAIRGLQAQVERARIELATDRHKLVFIGKVAVGKTTTICHLLGLIQKVQKTKKGGGRETAVNVVEDLLQTGSGYTTSCEVIIEPGSPTMISIRPYSAEELEKTIDEFARAVWVRTYPSSAIAKEDGNLIGQPPEEIKRAVQNIVGLVSNKDGDQAVDLAKTYGADGRVDTFTDITLERSALAEFRRDLTERARIPDRIQTRLTMPSTTADVCAWLRDNFRDVNLVRLSSFSIPHQIIVQVDTSILRIDGFPPLASVIDTKGLDAGQSRKDLDEYIHDDNSAFCLFTDAFTSAPTNVIDIIERALPAENRRRATKVILLVLPRLGEPEKVVGAEGTADERESGIIIRRGQIEDTLRSRGILVPKDNIIFYDPLLHFEPVSSGHRYPSDEEISAPTEDRRNLLASLCKAIDTRRAVLWQEIYDADSSLGSVLAGRTLTATEELLIENLQKAIAEFRQLSVANADRFLERFRGKWKHDKRHVMTFRATNARHGEYKARLINIFYDGKEITEDLAREVCQRQRGAILELIGDVINSEEAGRGLREVLGILKTEFDRWFADVIRNCGRSIQTYLQDEVFAPLDDSNEFWLDLQNRWGGGAGYKQDALNMYAAQMTGIEQYLANVIENNWRELIDRVTEFLEG